MTNPGLPTNVAQIFVAGTFRNFQGNALAQRLVLSPSLTVTINAGAEEVTLASEFSATPDSMTGFVSIPVVATDDPDLNPTNFTYTVTEPSGRKYPLAVSQDTPVFTRAGHPLSGQRVVWLHDAVPAPGPSSGVVQIVAGPQGPMGEVSAAQLSAAVAAAKLADRPDVSTTSAAVDSLLAVGQVGPFGVVVKKRAALDLASRLGTARLLRPGPAAENPLVTPLYPPPAVDGTVVGTAGSTTYGYRITAVNGSGESLPSALSNIGNANAVLDGTNYVALSWAAVSGAESYNVYRGGGTPLKVANTTATTYNDQGAAASGAPPQTRLPVANKAPIVGNPFGQAGVTFITNSVLVPPNTATAFTYLGTVPGLGAGVTATSYVPSPAGAPTITGDATETIPWAVEFDYEGAAFEIVTVGAVSGQAFRLVVNGEYMQSTGYNSWNLNNGTFNVKIDFGTRAVRRIRVEMKGSFNFGGIRREPDGTVMATSRSPLRLIVFGDSFTQPTWSDNLPGMATARINDTGHTGYPWQLGRLLGIRDTWASGSGGTGYLATNGKKTFRQRIADITSWSPDAVLVVGGINDSAQTAAAMTPETALFWNALRAALPNALLMGAVNYNGGPTKSGYSTYQTNIVTPVQAAVAGAGATYLDLMGLWTGTGKKGTPVGDGNADILVGPDGTHPTFDGHRTIARWLAMLIDRASVAA